MDAPNWLRSRLEGELQADRQELMEILRLPDYSIQDDRLRELAQRIGASTVRGGGGYADRAELIRNIHVAIQTKAMTATVETTSNYVILTFLLVLIALASTIAAFLAVARVPGCPA